MLLIGNQTWLKVQVLSDISCIFLYYSLTTLGDSQTLGEEYIGLLQVDSTLRSLPTKFVGDFLLLWNLQLAFLNSLLQVRLLAISLQVFGPRIFSKCLAKLETWFRNPNHVQDLQPKARECIITFINIIKSGSFWVGRLNLMFFYIFRKYYRLSQRMTKIHYVSSQIEELFDIELIQISRLGLYFELCWLRQLQLNIPIDWNNRSSSFNITAHFKSSIQVERFRS